MERNDITPYTLMLGLRELTEQVKRIADLLERQQAKTTYHYTNPIAAAKLDPTF